MATVDDPFLFVLLVVSLGWSLIAFGSVADVPVDSVRDGETKQVIQDPDTRIGERVIVSGTVTGTDPVVIALSETSVNRITVTGLNGADVRVNDRAYVIGELVAPSRVAAHRLLIEEPREITMMYVMSFIAGVFTLVQIARHWQFDRDARRFAPRTADSEE